jgi:uncharacterized protein YgiM (DUF1202 family)
MRPLRIIPVAAALALAASGSIGGAHAASMATPPAPAVSEYRTIADLEMTVSNSSGYANLREKPTTASRILDKLPQGTKVVVIDKTASGKWVHVKVNDKQGYIETKLLK